MMKNFVFLLLGYLSATAFLLMGLLFYSMSYSVLVFLVTLTAFLVCAPPSRAMIIRHTGLNLHRMPLVICCVLLFIAQFWVGISASMDAFAEDEIVQAQVDKARIATARQHARDKFLANKPALLAAIAKQRDEGKLDEAQTVLDRQAALTPDPDLDKLRASIEIARTEAALKDEAAIPLRQRLGLYLTLTKLAPANPQYAARAAALEAELKKVSAQEAAETAHASKATSRIDMLARQFDKRDGAHLKLQAEVKRTMKNAASYEYVETNYLDTGKGMNIWLTFRGMNAAGELIENTVLAEVDDSGNVLSIKDDES